MAGTEFKDPYMIIAEVETYCSCSSGFQKRKIAKITCVRNCLMLTVCQVRWIKTQKT